MIKISGKLTAQTIEKIVAEANEIAFKDGDTSTHGNSVADKLNDLESRLSGVETSGETPTVSPIFVKSGDKVLSLESSNGKETLSTTISLDYDKTSKQISLTGKNNSIIASIDTSDFVKDGMIQTATLVTEQESGITIDVPYIKMVFNGDTNSDPIRFSVKELIDIYTAANTILTDSFQAKESYDASQIKSGTSVEDAIAMLIAGISYAQENGGVTSIGGKTGAITLEGSLKENGTINLAIDSTNKISASINGLGSAAYTSSTAYATSTQGNTADSAIQSLTIAGKVLSKSDNTLTASAIKEAMDLSEFLTEESEPAFNASPAKNITSTQITNWEMSLPFNDTYATNANTWLTNGYIKTGKGKTSNLPSLCTDSDLWGILFFIAENEADGTGTQMYYPIDGKYAGRIFTRSLLGQKRSTGTKSIGTWQLIPLMSDIPTSLSGLTNDMGFITSADLPTYKTIDGVEITGDGDITTQYTGAGAVDITDHTITVPKYEGSRHIEIRETAKDNTLEIIATGMIAYSSEWSDAKVYESGEMIKLSGEDYDGIYVAKKQNVGINPTYVSSDVSLPYERYSGVSMTKNNSVVLPIAPAPTDKIIAAFTINDDIVSTSTTMQSIWGSCYTTSTRTCMCYIVGDKLKVDFFGGTYEYSKPIAKGDKFIMTVDSSGIECNGESQTWSTTTTESTGKNFAINDITLQYGTVTKSMTTWHSLKIYRNNIIQYDVFPVVLKEIANGQAVGTIGLWDDTNTTFYKFGESVIGEPLNAISGKDVWELVLQATKKFLTEHNLEAYTKTTDFATINNQSITEGGNITITVPDAYDDTELSGRVEALEGIDHSKFVTKLKTINGQSLAGDGNISLSTSTSYDDTDVQTRLSTLEGIDHSQYFPTSGGTISGVTKMTSQLMLLPSTLPVNATEAEKDASGGWIRCEEGETAKNNHAWRLGGNNRDHMDFYEYGADFRFYKSRNGVLNMIFQIKDDGLYENGTKLSNKYYSSTTANNSTTSWTCKELILPNGYKLSLTENGELQLTNGTVTTIYGDSSEMSELTDAELNEIFE